MGWLADPIADIPIYCHILPIFTIARWGYFWYFQTVSTAMFDCMVLKWFSEKQHVY